MDRNINERIRKPRRTKGTPFFVARNYYALAVVAFGSVSWLLYELWPESQKLKKSIKEGKFKYSEEAQERIREISLGVQDTTYDVALSRHRMRKQA